MILAIYNSNQFIAMRDTVIIAICSLSGSLVGVLSTYLMYRLNSNEQKLKEYSERLAEQVKAYWHLEELYAQYLAAQSPKSAKTIKQEFRDKVQEMGYERPTMTENDINKLLRI